MSSAQAHAVFQCQKCHQPLLLDASLKNLESTAAYTELIESTSSGHADQPARLTTPQSPRPTSASLSQAGSVSRKTIHALKPYPKHMNTGGNEIDSSFIVLAGGERPLPVDSTALLSSQFQSTQISKDADNDISELHTSHARIRMLSRFFDVLSSKSDIDHPLCQECTELALETMDNTLASVILEGQLYEEALANGDLQSLSDAQDRELDREISELQAQESKLARGIRQVEEERQSVNSQVQDLKRQQLGLDLLEKQYWKEMNKFEIDLASLSQDTQAVEVRYKLTQERLEKLNKINVYNDAFHIWHDGSFGTINGLRLGRLSSRPVQWNEINAAWGYTILLLDVLARKLSFTFDGLKLVPLASLSRIEKIGDDKAVYELHGSGDSNLSRLFWNRRFDQAMVAFLACVQQLTDHVMRLDALYRPKYTIIKDKIGDVSIRLQFNNDENWTKALKYLLTNLKWLLAFTAQHTRAQTAT